MAQEAALTETANAELRRLSARNQSFQCTDVKVGYAALFYKVVIWGSARTRRSLAVIFDIDETGVAGKFQRQASKVVRFCARRKVDPKDAGKVERTPVSNRPEEMEICPS